jgi:hypothetical protein
LILARLRFGGFAKNAKYFSDKPEIFKIARLHSDKLLFEGSVPRFLTGVFFSTGAIDLHESVLWLLLSVKSITPASPDTVRRNYAGFLSSRPDV